MEEAGPSMAQQELPEIPQFEYSEEEQESILADLDILVRDPIIPIFNLFKVIETTTKSGERGFDPLYIYRSRLVKAVVPQVPNYPEIVHWCAQNYLPEQRFIMSKDATRVIIKITPEAISAMLTFPQEPATREWSGRKDRFLQVSVRSNAPRTSGLPNNEGLQVSILFNTSFYLSTIFFHGPFAFRYFEK